MALIRPIPMSSNNIVPFVQAGSGTPIMLTSGSAQNISGTNYYPPYFYGCLKCSAITITVGSNGGGIIRFANGVASIDTLAGGTHTITDPDTVVSIFGFPNEAMSVTATF